MHTTNRPEQGISRRQEASEDGTGVHCPCGRSPLHNRVIHNPVDGLWNESADRAKPDTLEGGARDGVVTVNRSENTTHPLLMANVVSIHAKSLMTGVAMHLGSM